MQFVKATYDRRAADSADALVPAGGGRVTELVARPLLALHWPELTGFVQPLGGEYAARRALLERCRSRAATAWSSACSSTPIGRVGLDAMAQVDLSRRKHRNSDLHKLGQMATRSCRSPSAGSGDAGDEPRAAHAVRPRAAAAIASIDTDMTEHERPPIITVERYPLASAVTSRKKCLTVGAARSMSRSIRRASSST